MGTRLPAKEVRGVIISSLNLRLGDVEKALGKLELRVAGFEAKYGLYFKSLDQILIPTQLYSSLLLLLIFFILRFKQARAHRLGEIFYSYILFYSLKRFFIEFLRNDSPRIFYGLTFFQILSCGLFLVASGCLIKLFLVKKN